MGVSIGERQIGHRGEVRGAKGGTVKMGSCVNEDIGGEGFECCAGAGSDKGIPLGEEDAKGKGAEDERDTVFVVVIEERPCKARSGIEG